MLVDMQSTIKDELNIKSITFSKNEEHLVELSARPNLPILGPKYGNKMKLITPAIKNLSSRILFDIMEGKKHKFVVEDTNIVLSKEHLIFDKQSKAAMAIESNQHLTVAIETTLNEELIQEGLARELVHCIQQNRKDIELEVTDRINIFYNCKSLDPVVVAFKTYIQKETIAQNIEVVDQTESMADYNINGENCLLKIQKFYDKKPQPSLYKPEKNNLFIYAEPSISYKYSFS